MRPLPANTQIERNIIAAVLKEPNQFKRMQAESVNADDFHDPFTRAVWEFIDKRGGAVSADAVLEAFAGQIDSAAELLCIATTAGVDHWIAELKELTARRVAIQTADDLTRAAYEIRSPMIDAIPKLSESFAGIATRLGRGTAGDDMASQIEAYCAAQDAGSNGSEVIRYGIPAIDARLQHRRREIHILGAKPATGKTNFALNAIIGALSQRLRPAMFCQEMPSGSLISRIIANIADVEYSDVLNRRQRERCRPVEAHLLDMAKNHQFMLCGAGQYSHTAAGIRERLRRYRERAGSVDMVIVDYIQNMFPPPHLAKNADSRRIIDWNIMALQELAAEYDAAMLVLSQLSRAGQSGGRLEMTSLKESSQLEQSASIITLMNCADADPDYSQSVAITLECVKYRDGRPFQLDLLHNGGRCRFGRQYSMEV